MGGGLSIDNRTGIDVLVTLSQAGPLHWERIRPREKKPISCGQAWFSVDVMLWNDKKPKWNDVASPIFNSVGGTAGIVAGVAGLALALVAAPATAVTATVLSVGICSCSIIGGTAMAVNTMGNSAAERVFAKELTQENTIKWLTETPSKQSAEWLAEKNIIAVIPASMTRVYADGKTLILDYDLTTSEGGSRMTLSLKYSDEYKKPL